MKALKKRILGSLLALLLCAIHIGTDSCGIYVMTGDLSRVCLFQPAVKSPREMFPFFYSNSIYFQTNLYENEYAIYSNKGSIDANSRYYLSDYDVITEDWYKHLKKKVSREAIYDLLFSIDVKQFYQKYDSLKANNLFYKLLQTPAYRQELSYFEIIKEIELANYAGDEWNCNDCPEITKAGNLVWKDVYSNEVSNKSYYIKNDNPVQIDVLDSILKNISHTKNQFLINRYAFILCRYYYYGFDYASLAQTYQQYFAQQPDSYFLKNYALYFLALTKPDAERNYLFSLVYKNCPEKRYRTQELFQHSLLSQTLAFAKNKEEEATILMMGIAQNPYNCLDKVERIISIAPNHELVPFILTREINKIEDGLLGDKYTGIGGELANYTYEENKDNYYPWGENKAADEKKIIDRNRKKKMQLKRCLALVKSLSTKSGKYQSFYQLAAGYLSYINMDYGQARYYYMQNALINEQDKSVQLQLAINKLLLNISESNTIDENTETAVVNLLAIVNRKGAKYFYPEYIQSQLLFFIGQLYLEKGATYKGIMLLAHSKNVFDYQAPYYAKNAYHLMLDRANEADYDSIIYTINKKQKTAFEQILCAPGIQHVEQYDDNNTFNWDYNYYERVNSYTWNLNKVYDMKSTYHIQRNELAKAYAATCHIDTAYWSQFPNNYFRDDNPFWVYPGDLHYSFNKTGERFNKNIVLKQVLNLFKVAANSKGNAKALAYFQIANFYLSTTTHGKYWLLQNNYWYNYANDIDESFYQAYESDFVKNHPTYFKPTWALKYYLLALQESKTEDLAGMCTYMAWVASNRINKPNENNPYLNALKNKHLGTYYYDHYSNCELTDKFFAKYYQ